MTNNNQDNLLSAQSASEQQLPLPVFTLPAHGEMITSTITGNTYVIGDRIGEGHFGVVYACSDTWKNDLAAKVLKPRNQPYEAIKQGAVDEFQKLLALRHPNITFVYDAFEFRHTFYIITESQSGALSLSEACLVSMIMMAMFGRCLRQDVSYKQSILFT